MDARARRVAVSSGKLELFVSGTRFTAERYVYDAVDDLFRNERQHEGTRGVHWGSSVDVRAKGGGTPVGKKGIVFGAFANGGEPDANTLLSTGPCGSAAAARATRATTEGSVPRGSKDRCTSSPESERVTTTSIDSTSF